MRAFLYDTLTQDNDLKAELASGGSITDRVLPRRSQTTSIDAPRPFLIYGLGNDTNERLVDSTSDEDDAEAHRQFFQVWVHDSTMSWTDIDKLVDLVKKALEGKSSKAHRVVTVIWLETSQEFSNDTYNTLFRYIRFQAIIAKGGTS